MKPPGALLPTASIAAGIIASGLTGAAWWAGALLIGIAAATYATILKKSGDPVATMRLAKWHTLWITLLFAGIGMTDEYFSRPITLQQAWGEKMPEKVKAEILTVTPKTYGDKLEVKIEKTNRAKAQIMTGESGLTTGDIISIPTSRLKETATDTTAIIKQTASMLKARGILYTGFIPAGSIKHTGHKDTFRSKAERLRTRIEIKIENSHLKKETAEFLKAILMGDKTGLNQEIKLTFAHGGIAHMLALSGLHMGILAGFIMWLMWPARALGRYKWGYAAAIILLWGYVAITGMSYSSTRACIMITFAFAAIITERKNATAQALCMACMIIMLATPSALFDAGFQLSVVCVAALTAYATRLNPMSQRRHPKLHRVCEALLATIVASIASLPFTSYYFGQIPLMFLPTNFLLLPLIPPYLCCGVVFTAMLCAGTELSILVTILDRGYDFLVSATETLSGGTEYVASYQIPLWALTAWIIIISAGAWALNKKAT